MTKAEFVASVAQKTGFTKTVAAETLDAVLSTLVEIMAEDDKVTFPGFGTFCQSKRAARVGRNPQTGAELKIAAAKSGKFTAGKNLKNL